ncbi:Concanavalin A-like lectin/glucanases superfamily protein [Lutibacter oricola]|uniref:Concanavalin A-like lectin/glucanases superfamily protein n=1 Tax=Lutibacter oricola TaxID=762486 RepID=A0A1H2SUB8_9FLAO|nr:LamG domain-containing protein [Lutibacter oricola]SDW35170.1 Concanavalin A-like lectin/glucanases superfamily protein [Lutibacter oricola]
MRLATLLFFVSILTVTLHAQNSEDAPFFSEDLFTQSNQVESNLKPNSNDAVRGRVADFLVEADSCFTIQSNKRSKDISVSFWFLPKQLDVHSGTLIGEDGVFYFRYLSNRQIQFNHFHKADINTESLLSNNVWQHLGFTLSKNGSLTIYFNGEPVLKETISSNWWKQKASKLIIGNDRYGVKAEGSIDRLKIWDRTLTAKEFKNDFETSSFQTNLYHKLQAYLPLQGNFEDQSLESKDIELVRDIDFVNDSEKGIVANFNKETSLLKIKNLKFDKQLTISAWINPVKQEGVMGIAGNKDFSFRYKPNTQSLWFSVPMMFKTVSTQPKEDIANWLHLAVTVNYNHRVNFFINGKLVDSKTIGGNTGKEDYLEIGKSLWGDTFKGQMSQFAIWNKVLSPKEIKSVFEGKLEADKLLYKKTNKTTVYLITIFLLVIVFVLVYLILKKRKQQKVRVEKAVVTLQFPQKNAIYLFDVFRAFDKNGNDISHEFTPTLVRLFSLILLFPRVVKRHIGSAELSDILWETETVSQQKNNRGANMHRLRKILKEFNGITLNYEDKKWKFNLDEQLFIDAVFYNEASNEKVIAYPFKNLQLSKSLKIANFDTVISQLNEQHIQKTKEICAGNLDVEDWKTLRKSASLLLSIDPLSELALKYKITALVGLNEKQLALNCFKSFAANYKVMLVQEFPLTFEECMF